MGKSGGLVVVGSNPAAPTNSMSGPGRPRVKSQDNGLGTAARANAAASRVPGAAEASPDGDLGAPHGGARRRSMRRRCPLEWMTPGSQNHIRAP